MAPIPASILWQAELLKLDGNTYFKDRLGAAIDAYTEAIVLCPHVAVYWTDRALCFQKRKEWAKVENDCRKAIELDSNSVKIDAHAGGVNDLAFSSPSKQLCVITCGDDKIIKIKVFNFALISAFMKELEPASPVGQSDYDRLKLSTAPFMERNVEFLLDCMEDLSSEQNKFQYYYRNLSRNSVQQHAWIQKRREITWDEKMI